MKITSIDCIRSLLPDFIAAWAGTAVVGVAGAAGLAFGPVACGALAAGGISAFLACSLKSSKTAKRAADHDRKACDIKRFAYGSVATLCFA